MTFVTMYRSALSGAASKIAEYTRFSVHDVTAWLKAADDAGMTLSDAAGAIDEASRHNVPLLDNLPGAESGKPAGAYYMQDSRGYVGNAVSWWKQDRGGYTCDPRRAHIFTREQALSQHRRRATDIPWLKDYIDSVATLQVDMQRLDPGRALKDGAS